MSAATLTFARTNGRPRRFAFDAVLLLAVSGIMLLGLVMMTSASISIADKQQQDPLFFLVSSAVRRGLRRARAPSS